MKCWTRGEEFGVEKQADDDLSQPRTLYVSRRLLNEGAVRAWAASQGFESALPTGDMHVTVAYSREPVDWSKIEPDQDAIAVQGGARSVRQFGEGAVVLTLESPELQRRWQELRDAGASWDYPDYRPHVTITYAGAPADISAVEPYSGPLIFGPEEMEEVDPEGFDPDSIEEEALPKVLYKSNPNHDELGRFSSGPGEGSSPPDEDGPVLFHGTSSQLHSAIMREGLRPGRASSADAWAKKHGWAVHAMTIGDRAASVYATPDRAAAERYARYAQEVHGGDPVILEVRIPRARRDELLSVDEEDRSSVRFKGVVRPEWISMAKSDDPVIFMVAAASGLKKKGSVPRRPSRRMQKKQGF